MGKGNVSVPNLSMTSAAWSCVTPKRPCQCRQVRHSCSPLLTTNGVTASPELRSRSYIKHRVSFVSFLISFSFPHLSFSFSIQLLSLPLPLSFFNMQFLSASLFTIVSVAALVGASPTRPVGPTAIDYHNPTHIDSRSVNVTRVAKRETSFGNPDRVADQGDRYQLNYGSTGGHENACDGHYICCMSTCSISLLARFDLSRQQSTQISTRTVRHKMRSTSATQITLLMRVTATA